MERRGQPAGSCEATFGEAQRWLEEVTQKPFGNNDFRSALENGVLLCDLINKLKPGIIKRVNRLSTPIAGLDNVNVFLKACEKLGLNEAQLFHPGDLQDVSTRVTVRRKETYRRLKNVLITIYWLGRKAQVDPLYSGPHLNLRAFEGLLGTTLSKTLEDAGCPRSSVRDSGYCEAWFANREDVFPLQPSYRREDSVESLDSVESHTLSVTSDITLIAGSEGCGSDAEAEQGFRMSEVPAPLRRKRGDNHEDNHRGCVSPLTRENGTGSTPLIAVSTKWPYSDYWSESDSDADRPEPDLVQDDLANRRFHSSYPMAPVNYAVPVSRGHPRQLPGVTSRGLRSWVTISDASRQAAASSSASSMPDHSEQETPPSYRQIQEEHFLRALNQGTDGNSSSEDDRGYADPVHDDLYARRLEQNLHQTSTNQETDKFLPKHWTPQEDLRVKKIQLGSQRRPWYRKMQGFRLPLRTCVEKGSKSMGDILVDPADSQHRYQTSVTLDLCLEPVALREVRREQLRCMHIRVKESEAKWQEDLSRWKNRRRSVNLDLHRKWEKRKQMEAIMGRAGEGEEVQDHSDNEAHGKSVSTTCSSTHTLTHTRHEHTSDVVLHSRAPLARSNAVEIANFPGSCPRDLHSFEPPDKGERNQDGALPAEQASHSTCSSQCVDAMPGLPGFPWIDGTIDKTVPLTNGNPQPVSLNNHRVHWVRPVSMDCSDPQTGSSVDHGGPVDTQTDSFLQPSEDLQQQSLASVIQPRTPNYKQMGVSRLSSTLPRGFRRSEGSSRLSTGVTPRPFGAKSSAVSTLKYSKDDSHRSLLSGQKNRAPIPSFFTQTRKVITHTDLEQLSKDAEEDRVEQSKGWSSVDSGQSPVCKSRAFFPLSKAASLPDRGLGGRDRQVCYREMRISLNQRPNSSTDFGFETHWDSSGAYITFVQPGSPAELCQLQVGYEILAVSGQQVAEMSHGEWKASMADAMQKGSLLIDVRCHGNNGHPEHHISAASKPVVNGQPASSVSCEAESHSVNDAAVTFSNNGGSESAISDLQVPSISASSLSWSWDAEDERRRQEKWQREQERLLQEKYQRDQQRLEEEWQRAQQEVCGGEFGVIKDQISGEVTNGNDCPFSPSPFQSQTTPSTVVDSIQHMLEGPLEPAVESGLNEDRSPSKESDEDNRERSQWPAESYEFSMLSALDRTKSKSSPSLEAVYKQEVKGVNKDTRPQQKKKVKSLSQAEQDRQQILEEMRKRTQLFTDNSWIRQRSATVYKEPVVMGSPIRRFESLDSLEASGFGNRPSSATSFTSSNPVRPHSALGSFGPSWGPGRYSIGGVGRSSTLPASLSSGSVTESPQDRPASVPYTLEGNPIKKTLPITQHSRPVSGRRMCSYCGHSLGKGAAMVIESLGLCFHLVCFKCLACRCDLRGPESRSQVRVRHGQLFCETCYSRLRGRPIIK